MACDISRNRFVNTLSSSPRIAARSATAPAGSVRVQEAIDDLQKKSQTFDTTEPDPAKKGVNIILKIDLAKDASDAGKKINLSLNDLPLGEALKYVAQVADLQVKVDPYAVILEPLSK